MFLCLAQCLSRSYINLRIRNSNLIKNKDKQMFERIYIEISNICNLQCSFCPVVERDKKVLALHDFERILKQAKPLTKEVCLHLMGEPLAHPEIDKVLELTEKYQVPVQLTTNGFNIDRRQELVLASKSIRQINFSLQSYRDNFPDRDIKPYLEKVVRFSSQAQLLRPELYINYRLWNLGESGKAQLENEAIYLYLEEFWNISIERKVLVENIKSKRIWNKVYLHFDSRFDWPSLSYPHQGNLGRCHALTSHIGIHADGTVVPCCLDKEAIINLGNILDQDLEAILQSERAIKMREGFKQGVLVEDLCQRCSYINRFKKKKDAPKRPSSILNF